VNVPLTQELEAELARLAGVAGVDSGEFAARVLRGYVEQDARFRAAVGRGLEQAERDELIDHEQVVERIERLLQ